MHKQKGDGEQSQKGRKIHQKSAVISVFYINFQIKISSGKQRLPLVCQQFCGYSKIKDAEVKGWIWYLYV